MKNLIAALIVVMLAGILPGCGSAGKADDTTIRVGSLKGPTSLGLLSLMDKADKGETENTYEFQMATGADELLPLVVKGELDIALVPANVAAVLYKKTDGGIAVIDINTLGVLSLVTGTSELNSVADLKGKTICLTGKGTTPEASLRYLLEKNGLGENDYTLEFKSEATEVAAVLASQISSAPQLGQLYAFMLSPSSPQSSLKPEVSQSPPSAEASFFSAVFSSAACCAAAAFSSFSA